MLLSKSGQQGRTWGYGVLPLREFVRKGFDGDG